MKKMTIHAFLSKKTSISLAICFLFLLSCHTPSVLLEPQFRSTASAYPVKGRNGLMIKQKISFGNYNTVNVSRGWLKSYDVPFIVRFSGASEKISFTLTDSVLTARANCLGKIRRQEFQLVRNHFGIELDSEDAFAGNIQISGSQNWDFIIYNASNSHVLDDTFGFLTQGDQKIEIRAIRKMEGKNTILSELGIYGYELRKDGKVIGAVETLNRGKVLIANNLPAEERMLVSALSTALLLKTDLGS